VTAFSLVVGVVAVPATAASAASAGVGAAVSSGISAGAPAAAGIGAKKKVLTTEQKKAKKALDKAVKDLKTKEKNLKAAIKAQKKTAKAHAKAAKAAQTAKVRAVKGASKKVKARAKAAAKKLKSAKGKDDRAIALVARRTVMRDTAQAKVIRLDAKYAWLMQDLSTLDCGVGTTVVTASGAVERVWECGIVYKHEDGDTTHVKTTTNQLVEVRNIGLQTPERAKRNTKSNVLLPAQCGAEDAYQHFMGLMPEEITIVQLRSIANGANGWGGGSRPTRSVYKLNNATGAFDIDVQAEQIRSGWSLWWPTAAEWANNKAYLDLMNDAKARGVGIWNPNLCGPAAGNVPLMWFNQNAPTIGTNTEPAFGEYVILYNNTQADMDLTNWSLRDNSLNFFWSDSNSWMQDLNKFGPMILKPGEHRIVYLDNPPTEGYPNGYPLSATEYRYFNWGHSPGPQLTNGSVSASFSPNYANGDGVYLQDPLGNIRASMTNPCNSAAMCDTPQWVTDIISRTRAEQIIPIPVALNKVRNEYIHPTDPSKNIPGRDTYNPVVSIDTTKTFEENMLLLEAKGFTVVEGAAVASVAATTHAAQITNADGIVVTNLRVPIADLTGKTRTTIKLHRGNGSNLVPDVTNQTASAACIALIAAKFTCTVTAGDENRIVATTTPLAGTTAVHNTAVTLNYVPLVVP
jgi:endonuclease YncB( thermonuclease family)